MSQVIKFRDNIEICISNNGSSDNTKEVVATFEEKYFDLIKYSENEKNLGFDINVLKVVGMAEGEFVWSISDDDLIVENGFKQVINFLIKNKDKKMGGMVVKFNSYGTDPKTGKQIKYQSFVNKNKPETYGGLSFVEMLRDNIPYQGLSVLIFNNSLLKKILIEKKDLAEKGIGTGQFHSWLFFLLFILNKEARCHVLNKAIVVSLSKTRYPMKKYINLICCWKIKFFDSLLSVIDKSEKDIIEAVKNMRGNPSLSIIYIVALYKAFGMVNFASYVECMKLSFKYLFFVKAFFVSVCLAIILMTPSNIVEKICKLSLKFRFKTREERESNWLETCIVFSSWRKISATQEAK